MKPGTVLGADRFLLIEALGQGGMGVVWLAHDQRLDEDVALKLVPPEIRTDAGALEDLRRETLRSRKLSHPNIIRLHDLNEFPGEPPFISMEFVDGQTVAAWKSQQSQRLFTWEQLRPIARQLCDALDYAHGEKVVHRDLKPANMMVDRRGRLKLADFGLAAVVSELTSRVSLKANTSGTPAYMSPQQMDGRTPRVTDDIYALGATLYELLTSKPPFYHGDIPHQVRNLPPDPVDQRLAELELTNPVPPYVSALIMACLAKDPAQRPQSAAAVAEWLQLGGQSVSSALATEITHRSVAAANPTTPSSAAPPLGIPVAEPDTRREFPSGPAAVPERSRSRSFKWAGIVVVLLIAVAIGVAVLRRDPGGSSTTSGAPSSPGLADAPSVEGAQSIFNGRNLDGWSMVGPRVWRVEGGVIKALTREPRRSYLVLDRPVSGNFEISFDYKPPGRVEGDGNHGFFYRSSMPSGIGNEMARGVGIVLGGDLPGGLYASRADGSPGDVDPPSQSAQWRLDDWNRVRIRMENGRLMHFINDRVVYQAEMNRIASVPLGNQVAFELWNNFGGGERAVEIRNISLQVHQGPAAARTATPAASGAWDDLYNNNRPDTARFRGFRTSDFPEGSWTVEEGVLKAVPGAHQVDLVTRDRYGDFELWVEYSLPPDGNSGILYRVGEESRNTHDTAPEMQLTGSSARGVTRPEQRNGALYALLAPTGTPGQPMGSNLHLAQLKVQNGQVEHRINNVLVLSYSWEDPALRQAIQRSDFDRTRFMQAPEGHIAIQHRGTEMQIRRMRVRRL